MPLDLASINAALYAQLKSASAGAAVRAQLGPATKADGVLPAHLLRKPLPLRPIIAWRGGAVGGVSDELRAVTGYWWVYDDSAQGYIRINTIAGLIAAAYPFDALPHARCLAGPVGQESEDGPLGGLLVRNIRITYQRRA